MAKKLRALNQAHRPDHTRRSRLLVFGGLGALAVAALTLTAVAMVSQRSGAGAADLAPAPTFSTPKPEAEPTETPDTAPEPVLLEDSQRILAAGEEPGHLLRSVLAPCGAGDATAEVSFDDGASWQPTLVTDVAGAAIRQLDAHDSTITRATFVDASCQPAVARSFTGGSAWEPETPGSGIWALQNDDNAAAWSPQGAVELPCTAVSLVGEAARAIALCSDASVTVTEDAGAAWSQPVPVAGAGAVGIAPAGFIVATTHGDAECVGVRTAPFSGSQLGTTGGCLAGEFAAPTIAVTASASTQYVWAGEQVFRSVDSGSSWS